MLGWSLETGCVSAPLRLKRKSGSELLWKVSQDDDDDDNFLDTGSTEFSIRYLFSNQNKAQRFLDTVSILLGVGGHFLCATIDTRVVVQELMRLGLDYYQDTPEEDKIQVVFETAHALLPLHSDMAK